MKVSPWIIPYLIVGVILSGIFEDYARLRCVPPISKTAAVVMIAFWPPIMLIHGVARIENYCLTETK